MARKSAGLEIDRADRFAAREIQLQRLGLGALALFVLLGAAGLFGDGPLSRAETRSGNLAVYYERFARQTATQVLVVEASTGSASDARISFSKEFLGHYSIEESRPLQVESEADGEEMTFIVPAADGVARLELRLEASRPGVFTSRVAVTGGASAQIRQIVFF